MTLRLRIALGFAAVALATAAAVSLATPHIVSLGFAEFESDLEATPTPAVPAGTAAPRSLEPPDAGTSRDGAGEAAGEAESAGAGAGAGASDGEGTEAGEGAEPGEPGAAAIPTRSPARVAAPSEIALAVAPSAEPSPGTPASRSMPPAGSAAIAAAGGQSPSDNEAQEAAESATNAARSQVQQDTTLRLVLVALLAALAASIAGLLAAGRLTRPVAALQQAAEAVAGGDLTRRSGLGGRSDEFGQLGRSFDTMAAELQRADENRRRFLQDAAHELRTPLAVIEATSSAILDGVYEPERRHLETIREQSRALSRIVDDLRTISLAEVGQLPLQREEVDMAAALQSAARAFEVRAADAGVRIGVAAGSGLRVLADPDRVRQMVAALVDNALRHSERGEIRLVAARAGERVRIAVDDSGPGFPDDVLPKAFDRFYQGDPAPGRHVGTSGLGLSIVRALAEAQDGRAGAENRPEGGARVWFELPLA